MPSNDFEERLRARLSHAEYPPSFGVWDNISDKMKPLPWWRDRRWLIAATLFLCVCAGGYIYYLQFNSPTYPSDITQQQPSSQHTEKSEQPSTEKEPPSNQVISAPSQEDLSPTLSIQSEQLSEEPSSNTYTNIDESLASALTSNPANTYDARKESSTHIENEQRHFVDTISKEIQSSRVIDFAIQSIDEYRYNDLSTADFHNLPTLGMGAVTSGRRKKHRKSQIGFSMYVNPVTAWYTSTNFRVDQDRNASEAPVNPDTEFVPNNQTVFYDITYSRTGVEAGLHITYELNHKLHLRTGAGIFRSGKHQLQGITLNPVFEDNRTDQFGDFSLQEVEVANSAFRTIQLIIPLAGDYSINTGRSRWIISMGVALNTNLEDTNFPTVDVTESNASAEENQLIQVNQTHFQITAGIRYQYSIRPGLSVYAGPVQTYGISPLYQTATNESIYLNRLGIKMGILFD